MPGKIFLHVDLDAFFASVEVLDHPEYKNKPVIVGGLPTDERSVVSTASYEARKYGVHSAMPIFKAYQLCPQGIFVRGNYQRYSEKSMEVMNIFKDFSPDVAQVSIDEAFIEITGTEKLFGPPVEVAKKIKDRVKNECGLTVSVGIASTKYVAKICSGYRKPNGLTVVPEGCEEKFMLSLPLEKLWGAGEKTLEALHKCGIYTMEQLYSKNEMLLQSIFGKNTGSFLYDAVRGGRKVELGQEAENHSISNETTFGHDLTDINAIETALLELCHTVMFRLRRNKVHSQTVCVKIKYNDFSQVTIQETSNRIVTSIDDFFGRAKNLFNKKWDKTKPIRLLGVGVHKVETNDIPVQKDLFDFGEEKKAKSENAIVKIEEKFGLKIKKARNLCIPLITGLFILFQFFNVQKLFAQSEKSLQGPVILSLPDETIIQQKEESSPFLFSDDNSDFSFETFGFWQGELSSTISGNINHKTQYAPFSINFGTPVFSQKVDLTANLTIKKNFFFNLNFADNFETNLIQAGYKNNNSFINQFKIANRGIVIPEGYSSSLTGTSIYGGNNESPGIEFSASKEKIIIDGAVRIDGLNKLSKTFYGLNEVQLNYIQVNNFEKFTNYYLPSATIASSIFKIYRQSNSQWEEINPADFQINLNDLSLTILRNNSGIKKLAIMFNEYESLGELQNQVQQYIDQVKEIFEKSNFKIEKYIKDLWIQINGRNCLLIQDNNFFSPFQNCSIYNTTYFAESSQNDQCSILYKNSETESDDFDVQRVEDSKGILKFCLVGKNSIAAYQNFPLAEINPEIYFGLKPLDTDKQIQLVFKHYTKVTSYFIGNNAETSSVNVKINGITDIGAKYDSTTGTIKTSTAAGDFDKVQISWNESDFTKDLFLKSETGIKYKINNNFILDSSISSSFPVSEQSAASGQLNLNTGLNYWSDNLKFKTGFSGSTNGILKTSIKPLFEFNQEEETTNFLTKQSALKTDIITDEFYIEPSISTSLDSQITGYKSILYSDFSKANTAHSSAIWTSIKIHLGNQGFNLPDANQLYISIKNENPDSKDFKIFIQLGNPDYGEELFEITDQIDFAKNDWQIADIQLSEQTRSFLLNYPYINLVVKKDSNNINNQTGIQNIVKISLGPWSYEATDINVKCDQIIRCTTSRDYNYNSEKKSGKKNYYQNIQWKYLQTPDNFTDTKLHLTKYFKETNLSEYEEIYFDFKIDAEEKNPDDSLILQNQFTIILSSQNNTSLKVSFNLKELEKEIINSGKFHRIIINSKNLSLSIDGKTIDSTIEFNSSVKPVKFEFSFDTLTNSKTFLKSGTFSITNIYLTGNKKQFLASNYTDFTADYHNLFFYLQTTSKACLFEDNSSQAEADITAALSYNFWNFKLDSSVKAQYSTLETESNFFNSSNLSGITNYKINLSTEKPLFNFIKFQTINEENKNSKSAVSSEIITLDFSAFKIPLEINGKALAQIDSFSADQELSASITSKTKYNDLIIKAKGCLSKEKNSETTSLFLESKKLEYDFTGSESKNRTIDLSIEESFKIPDTNINPKLQIISRTNNSVSFVDSTKTIFQYPFKIKNTKFLFEYNKKIDSQKSTQDLYSGTYLDDAANLLSSKSIYFWQMFPIHDLITKEISDRIQDTNSTYETNYVFKVSKQMSNTTADFFIPQNGGVTLGRKLSSEHQQKDIYKIAVNLTNQSVNMFGKTGAKPIFNWYKKDSFFSNANINLLFCNNNIPSVELSWFAENQLFFNDKNNLRSTITFDFENFTNNSISATCQYFYKGNKSFITSLARTFTKSEFPESKIMRSENFCYKFQTSDSSSFYADRLLIQSLEYYHKNESQLNKNLNLWISAGFLVYDSKNISSRIDINTSIGGKVSF